MRAAGGERSSDKWRTNVSCFWTHSNIADLISIPKHSVFAVFFNQCNVDNEVLIPGCMSVRTKNKKHNETYQNFYAIKMQSGEQRKLG